MSNTVLEWIPYSRGMEIIRMLADMVTHNSPTGGLYVLAGPPNNGKTAIVDRLLGMYPTSVDRTAERSHIPILALDMPPRPTVVRNLRQALRTTGAPVMSCPPQRDITYLAAVLAGAGTRLIVLDDAQHILAGTPVQRTSLLSFWRSVAAGAGAAILLIGTARVFELGSDVKKAHIFPMPPWPLDQEFSSMVRTLERHLMCGHEIIAADDIPVLHKISGGRLGELIAAITSLVGSSPMLESELGKQVGLEARFRRAEQVV